MQNLTDNLNFVLNGNEWTDLDSTSKNGAIMSMHHKDLPFITIEVHTDDYADAPDKMAEYFGTIMREYDLEQEYQKSDHTDWDEFLKGEYPDFMENEGEVYCYATKEEFLKEYKIDTPENRESAELCLGAQIEEYQYYLDGEVYGYVVKINGESGDSCWGYYGTDHIRDYVTDIVTKEALIAFCDEPLKYFNLSPFVGNWLGQWLIDRATKAAKTMLMGYDELNPLSVFWFQQFVFMLNNLKGERLNMHVWQKYPSVFDAWMHDYTFPDQFSEAWPQITEYDGETLLFADAFGDKDAVNAAQQKAYNDLYAAYFHPKLDLNYGND